MFVVSVQREAAARPPAAEDEGQLEDVLEQLEEERARNASLEVCAVLAGC